MLLGIHIQNFSVLHDTVFGLSYAELIHEPLKRLEDIFDATRKGMPDDRQPLDRILSREESRAQAHLQRTASLRPLPSGDRP